MALPLRCDLPFDAGSRETVLERWQSAIEELKVNLRLHSEVVGIARAEGATSSLAITLNNGEVLNAETVVLAIGMQGNLRKLAIPGAEHNSRIQYQLDDPDEYQGETIVVVGAGDAAIENALALSQHNEVIIVNRRDEFARAKLGNLQAITKAIESGQIECYYESAPIAMEEESLRLMTAKGEANVRCDRVVARLGAEPPRKLLQSFGIEFTNESANALPVLDERYQTSIGGLYVIGALSGSPLIKQAMNQGYEVVDYIRGNTDLLPADETLLADKLEPLAKFAQHLSREAQSADSSPTVSEILRVIQGRTPLFEELNPLLMRELMLESDAREVPPGQLIFKRNDYSSSFFSIVAGSVLIALGAEQRLELETGDYFGEMGLISGRRRSADAVAGPRGAIVVETNRRAMVKLLNTEPQVKRALDRATVARHIQTFLAPHLSKGELALVSNSATIEPHSLGDSLFEEGESGDDLLLIRKGSVTVSKTIAPRDIRFRGHPLCSWARARNLRTGAAHPCAPGRGGAHGADPLAAPGMGAGPDRGGRDGGGAEPGPPRLRGRAAERGPAMVPRGGAPLGSGPDRDRRMQRTAGADPGSAAPSGGGDRWQRDGDPASDAGDWRRAGCGDALARRTGP